jgi:hypothetical protein
MLQIICCHENVSYCQITFGFQKDKNNFLTKPVHYEKVPLIKAITLFLGVILLTTSLFQCTKVGDNIEHLDRSYPSIPDSTIYAAFNDNYTIPSADATPATMM